MKIGIICYPTHGGSGVIAAELGKGLSRLGHEVHLISYHLPVRLVGSTPRMWFHLVKVGSYPLFRFPPYTLALASKTAEIVEQYHLELIHAHYAIPHSTSAQFAKQILGGSGPKIITTLHGTDIHLVGLDPSYFRVTKHALEQSDGLTAVSEYLASTAKVRFSLENKIKIIPNFVDTSIFRRQKNPELRAQYAPPHERLIVHISNFRPLKRVSDVVHIFNKVLAEVPARLLLVGHGPEFDNTLEVVTKLGLEQKVTFLYLVDKVEDILSVADLLLLPSEMESFGLAALEAESCGVPVVGSSVGGLQEVVEHGRSGYLAPVGDIDRMAHWSCHILKDSGLAEHLGARGREIALSKFSKEKSVRSYELYYQEILGL